MIRFWIIFNTLLIVILTTTISFSSDYNNESLFETLANARLREAPTLSSKVISLIPGGFILSVVEPNREDQEWYQIKRAPGDYPEGYIHSSLLKPFTFSYELKELENKYHKIKYFWPGESGNGYVYPQYQARLYTKDGQFISNLPRLSDYDRKTINIIPTGLEDDQPFYRLEYHSGGAHCCSSYKYLSKSPLFIDEFTIDTKHSSSHEIYDVSGNREYRIKLSDWSYAYWLYCFASSPAPSVILKVEGDKLLVSQADMIQPPPSAKQLQTLVEQFDPTKEMSDIEIDAFFGKLTGVMLDLIYTGNVTSADDFLFKVWPANLKFKYYDKDFDRDVYRAELFTKIMESRYYMEWMLPGDL